MWNGEANMADEKKSQDSDDSTIPNAPATILKTETIIKISRKLCINGTIHNWMNVADELGFESEEIYGDFANNNGCKPAQTMLNEWRFRRGGRLPKLVEVFKKLELLSCLEELKDYLADLRKFTEHHNDHNDDGDTSSSGTESICEDSFQPPRGSHFPPFKNSSGRPPLDNQELKTLCTTLKENRESKITETKHSEVVQKKENDFETKLQKDEDGKQNDHKSPPDIITFTGWPNFTRSISEPGRTNNKNLRDFNRTNSQDNSKKCKEKKNSTIFSKGNFLKKFKFPKRKKRYDPKTVVEVQVYHKENKPSESTNLSPLQGDGIQQMVDVPRPISSSSEDSLPSSPMSQGYGSEPDIEDPENKNKRIYIISNPGESEIFSKALQLYWRFLEKGYQCNMFAMNLNEEVEVGIFRYQMEQFMAADYLFLCVSEELHKNFVECRKNIPFRDDNSRSLRQLSDLMMGFLAKNCCNKHGKIMPILLTEDSHNHIPIFLVGYLSYYWPQHETKIENIIHGRPDIIIPVSNLREQAPQKIYGLKVIED